MVGRGILSDVEADVTGPASREDQHIAEAGGQCCVSELGPVACPQRPLGHILAGTVQAERLRAEGRADSEPVAGNATPAERARNRRVEITLFVANGSR